jgi:mannose/fructose/N-acetylgalactosamine-specific phosphotransferase system component IIC
MRGQEVWDMVKWPAHRFLQVAVCGILVALIMVPVVQWLLHAGLPLWLHIPAAFLALNLMAVGALGAGVALVEYRARSAQQQRQA